jgi:hypothetical protein
VQSHLALQLQVILDQKLQRDLLLLNSSANRFYNLGSIKEMVRTEDVSDLVVTKFNHKDWGV